MNVQVFKMQPLSTHLSWMTLESRRSAGALLKGDEINDIGGMNVVRCEAKVELFVLH